MTTWEDKLDLPGECGRVVQLAQSGKETIVNFGSLVLMALADGDAFIFDVEDKFACVLCRRGEPTEFLVEDRGKQWAFAWPHHYVQRRGRVCLVKKEDPSIVEMTEVRATDVERAINRYNQQGGTNYHF